MKKILTFIMMVVVVFMAVGCDSEISDSTTTTMASVTTTSATAAENEFSKITILDTDDVSFVIKGYEKDEMWGMWSLEVFIENKTEESLMFTWEDVSINGYMIDPFWAAEISAGKKENTSISFFLSDFEENDIVEVEDIEFSLIAYHLNEETFEANNYVDETFEVSLKN